MSHFAGNFCAQQLQEILTGLMQINSENAVSTEEQAARYVHRILTGHGIEAELEWAAPGRPNVIARLKGVNPGRTVFFNGHLDTVATGPGWTVDPYAATVKDGRLYGRGAADMKSGVAAMIYAAILLKQQSRPINGTLVLVFNVDEECVNMGMKQFVAQKPVADYAIIGEPTDLDICIGHKGVGRYRLKTFGQAGHTGFIKDQDNAIYKMAKFIAGLEELGHLTRLKEHPIIGNASLTVTMIKGGTAPNIVPDTCEIEIDRRVLPGEQQEAVLTEIREYLDSVAAQQQLKYQLEHYTYLPASLIDEHHPLVENLHKAAGPIRNFPVRIKPFQATCEAPFFSRELGIPTVIFGPGSLQQAHIVDEYVELSQVNQAALIYAELARQLLDEGE